MNLTGNLDDDWLANGIAETLATDLSARTGVQVVGQERVHELTRALSPLDKPEPPETYGITVGRRLGVRWIVSGAYQRLQDRVRITARIVDVQTGTAARTVREDGDVSGLLDLQDRVSRRLFERLDLQAPGPVS